MSEILIGSNPDDVNATTTLPQTAEDKAKQLPEVSGYRILCAIPEAEKEFESGLIKSDQTLRNEEVLSTVFFVVKMGPDCYKDEKRFPSGPWCKVGDRVAFAKHTGKVFRDPKDKEVLYLVQNDEDIIAVIGDDNE